MTTVYISGPMSGKPGYNFYEFQLAATAFRDAGFKVLNPAEWSVYPEGVKTHDWYIERDIARLQQAIDSGEQVYMYMLAGWENSDGAKREKQTMDDAGLGHKVLYYLPDKATASPQPAAPLTATPQQALFNLHHELCKEAFSIMEAKNHDYTSGGGDPYANFRDSEGLNVHPVIGILLRMRDKQQRVKSFVECGKLKVKGESVKDAILDQINYLVLQYGMILEDQQDGEVRAGD